MSLEEPAGTTLMAWGESHVLALDDVPRVFDLASGKVVERFSGLPGAISRFQPSVSMKPPAPPWVARDPGADRFAVTAGERVWVVTRQS